MPPDAHCPDESIPFDDVLVTIFSGARLSRTASEPRLHKAAAFEIHQADACLARSLYSLLRIVELSVRNAVDTQLRIRLQTPDWLRSPPSGLVWKPTERETIAKALRVVENAARATPMAHVHDRLVSRLSFGFWPHLFKEDYEHKLWYPALRELFPDKKVRGHEVFERLQKLREVRNRVAHHDAVTPQRAALVLEIAGWLSAHLQPDTRNPRSTLVLRRVLEPHLTDVASRSAVLEALLRR